MHFIDLDAFQRVCDCKSCLLKFSAAQPVQLCTEGIQHVRAHEIHWLIYHSQGVISSHGEEECHRAMASLRRVDEKGEATFVLQSRTGRFRNFPGWKGRKGLV